MPLSKKQLLWQSFLDFVFFQSRLIWACLRGKTSGDRARRQLIVVSRFVLNRPARCVRKKIITGYRWCQPSFLPQIHWQIHLFYLLFFPFAAENYDTFDLRFIHALGDMYESTKKWRAFSRWPGDGGGSGGDGKSTRDRKELRHVLTGGKPNYADRLSDRQFVRRNGRRLFPEIPLFLLRHYLTPLFKRSLASRRQRQWRLSGRSSSSERATSSQWRGDLSSDENDGHFNNRLFEAHLESFRRAHNWAWRRRD